MTEDTRSNFKHLSDTRLAAVSVRPKLQTSEAFSLSSQRRLGPKSSILPPFFRSQLTLRLTVRSFKSPRAPWFVTAALAVVLLIFAVLYHLANNFTYNLSPAAANLVGSSADYPLKSLKYDAKAKAHTLEGSAPEANSVHIGVNSYSAVLPDIASKGISITDPVTKVKLGFAPQFKVGNGQLQKGRMLYPLPNYKHAQLVYTLKSNGVEENLVLNKRGSSDTTNFSYKLDLSAGLEARVMPDGSVGVYGGDSVLYGNISYGSPADQAKLEKARQNSKKTTLMYGIPKPVIKGGGKHISARFKLVGSILTVQVKGLKQASYPLSIDPSLVVTTGSDWTSGNGDNIDFSVSGQVSRSALTGGSVGSWTNTGSGMLGPRYGGQAVAYNGFIYTIGGRTGAAANIVQYAAINADGTIGTWQYTSLLPDARFLFSAVINAGYVYVIGGQIDDGYTPTTTVIYAKFNADGTLGAWTATVAFSVARTQQVAWVSSNVLYVAGGCTNTCAGGNIGGQGGVGLTPVQTTSVEYAPLNTGTGAVSSAVWTATTAMPTALRYQAAAVDNGRVYLAGGDNNGGSSAIYVGTLAGGGGVTAWTTSSTTLPTTNIAPITYITNGRFYLLDGDSGALQQTTANTYWTSYNSGNGQLGSSWTQTASTQHDNVLAGSVLYGGKIYMLGGVSNGRLAIVGSYEDWSHVEYSTVNADGSLSSWQYLNPLTLGRLSAQMVAMNGYVYSVGGGLDNLGPTSDVFYASIDSNGNIGTWLQTTSSNEQFLYSSLAAHNGALYAWANPYSDTRIQMAIPNADGSIDHWVTIANLPQQRTYATGVILGNYIYFVGGFYTTTNVLNQVTYNVVPDVYYAPILANNTIGTWALTTAMPAGRDAGNMFTYNNHLYYAGGVVTGSAGAQPQIYMATQNIDGTVSSWQTLTTTYATYQAQLFAWKGYLYSLGGNGNTAQTANYYAPIYADGTLGTFQLTTALPVARVYNFGFGYANNVYVAGDDYEGQVIKATIDPAGAVGASQSGTAFPDSRIFSGSVVYNGYLYVSGGCSAGCNTATPTTISSIKYAKLNADGTLGSWNTATNGLTLGIYAHSMTAYNGYLYITGGINTLAASLNTAQYAPVGANGDISAVWQSSSNTMSTGKFLHGSAAYNGYLYVTGGNTATIASSSYTNKVEYAPINADGSIGSWALATAFSNARDTHATLINAGRIYVIGGYPNLADIQYALIGTAGNLVSQTCPDNSTAVWCATTNLPAGRSGMTASVSNGMLYIAGGASDASGSSFVGTVFYAPINANGSLGAFTTNGQSLSTARAGSGGAIYNGWLYDTSGCSSGSINVCSTYTTTTERMPISNGGTGIIGTWSVSSSHLNTARYRYSATVYNGWVYILGGIGLAGNLTSIEYAQLMPDGSVGAWTVNPTSLPVASSGYEAAAYNGVIYTAAGNTVYSAQIDPVAHTTGSWTSVSTFNGSRSMGALLAYGGYLYIIGGSFFADVQYIAINANGSLSTPANCTPPNGQTWCTAASFSGARYGFGFAQQNGYIYIVAGCSDGSANCATGHINSVYYAHLAASGGLDSNAGCGSAWCRGPDYPSNGQEMALVVANGFLEAKGVVFGNDYAAPILAGGNLGSWQQTTYPGVNNVGFGVYWHGQIITFGGCVAGSCSNISSNVQTTGQLATARVGSYSRFVSTDKDTAPVNILARFTSGANTLNLIYDDAPLTLTTNNIYYANLSIPSDTKVNVLNSIPSAYYYFQFSLDDTVNASFPDTLSTPTTLNYFQLNYHPNSSMRLRGGKTFNAGSQQSLDAP